MTWARAWLALAVGVALAGSCQRSLENAACPCVSGWVCCARDNLCRPAAAGCSGGDGAADAAPTADVVDVVSPICYHEVRASQPRFAAGPDGALHLAYVDYDRPGAALVSPGVLYRRWFAGADLVEEVSATGTAPQVAIGPDGGVHIFYAEPGLGAVHATRAGDRDWRYEPVGISGYPAAAAISAEGRFYLVYSQADDTLRIWTADRDGSAAADAGFRETAINGTAEMRVDAGGHVHLAYGSAGEGQVIYATNRSGSWVTETVAGGSNSPALALDGDRKAHLLFSGGGANIVYATNRTGAWVLNKIDTGSGFARALVIDAAGAARAVYDDAQKGVLAYASNATGAWVTSVLATVDPAAYLWGAFIDIAPDGDELIGYRWGFATGQYPPEEHVAVRVRGSAARSCQEEPKDDAGSH